MKKFIIKGGKKLSGTIAVSGAKNSALKLIPASFLSKQKTIIKNVPNIEDVHRMYEIIEALGGTVIKKSKSSIEIDPSGIRTTKIPHDLGRQLRTSVMFIAPLLARFGKVSFPHPGGCIIGKRPIDMFLEGYKALGASIRMDDSYYHISAKNGLKGGKYVFRRVAVTVTESLIMAASLAKGTTKLVFAACEPEISSLSQQLNKRGAKITGAGTHNIQIQGVSNIKGGIFTCLPDRIECGSFAILGALLSDSLKIISCDPTHLEVFWLYLKKAGVNFKLGKNYVQILKQNRPFFAVPDVITHEYPGFVSDLQAPFTVLLTQAKGLSMVHETIFEGRLFYTDILNRMGADIILCDPHRVVVNGPSKLEAKNIESPDLRAGMALIIAAMVAKGVSKIENIYQINRGYENIEKRLKNIGADIKMID